MRKVLDTNLDTKCMHSHRTLVVILHYLRINQQSNIHAVFHLGSVKTVSLSEVCLATSEDITN